MACNLTIGRNEPCKDSIGGLDSVYFVNYNSGSLATSSQANTDALIESLPSGLTVYQYQLKGNSRYTETFNSSRVKGNTLLSQ